MRMDSTNHQNDLIVLLGQHKYGKRIYIAWGSFLEPGLAVHIITKVFEPDPGRIDPRYVTDRSTSQIMK